MARLLGDSGLVFVEPRVLSPFAGETYAALVRHADAIGAAVRDAGHRVVGPLGEVTAGPLDRPRAHAPLFLRDGPHGVRGRVAFDGDRVLLRGQPTDLDRAALEALVLARPELASADVVGRVLLQDALLPVDAYVAGPTEAKYVAQIEPAHAVFGIAAPAIVARPSAAWSEREEVDAIRAAGIDPATVVAPQLGSASGERVVPLESLRAAFRALEALRPRNKPQERVLSPLSIVARHGVDALRAGLVRVVESSGPTVVALP